MKTKTILVTLAAVSLTGCAGMGAYEAQVKIAEQRAVEAKHYADAMWQIAQGGDTTVRTVAAMSLQSKMQGGAGQGFVLAPSPWMQAMQALVPAAVQAYGIRQNTRMQMHTSDNSLSQNLGLYGTFERFAAEINDPTIVTQPAPVIVEQPAPVIVDPVVVDPVVVDPVVIQTGGQ